LEVTREEENLYLIFEYMEQNLYQYIQSRKQSPFMENEIRNIL